MFLFLMMMAAPSLCRSKHLPSEQQIGSVGLTRLTSQSILYLAKWKSWLLSKDCIIFAEYLSPLGFSPF